MADTTSSYFHNRQLDHDFYEGIRCHYGTLGSPDLLTQISHDTGTIVSLVAGDIATIKLESGPQIVNLFIFNSHDPDERLWAQFSSVIEGAFLRRYSRLWSTMAKCRPMATVIEDTVAPTSEYGTAIGKHHFLFGGSETPADWRAGGGPIGIKSTWERLVDALETSGWDAGILTDCVCLFQKTAIDPQTQRLQIFPSDAKAGDRLVLFAELDINLVFALSPYRDGSRSAAELDGSVDEVTVSVHRNVAEPLGWPYKGISYPDLGLYEDASGSRSTAVMATPGHGLVR